MSALSVFCATLGEGECALIASPISRRYLTGFSSSDGFLIATKGEAILLLDSRYYEMACLQKKAGTLPVELTLSPQRLSAFFPVFLREKGIGRIYFEDRSVTVSTLESWKELFAGEFLPLTDRIEKMRVVKSAEEIRRVRAAQALAEEAFSYLLPRLAVGRREIELAAELEFFMKKNGASAPSFETICVSGARTSLPHGRATEKKLEKGDFITLDFGCMLDGYASDMTRTVCLGRATDQMRLVYDTVLAAQEAGLSAIRAGVTGKAVDDAARSVIEKAGFGSRFGHSTGHGIGLQVHEAPSFSPSYEKQIPAGAILSVEPGIYLEGAFGVRIEDLAVVTESGFENLNTAPKLLLEL